MLDTTCVGVPLADGRKTIADEFGCAVRIDRGVPLNDALDAETDGSMRCLRTAAEIIQYNTVTLTPEHVFI